MYFVVSSVYQCLINVIEQNKKPLKRKIETRLILKQPNELQMLRKALRVIREKN